MNWKSIVGTVAPVLATALGGPLAGVAVRSIASGLLGTEDADEAQVEQAIRNASPEDLAKLRTIESDFAAKMKSLDVDLERIHAGDRDSARQRQAKMGDWTPSILGALIILGFFAVLAAMMAWQVPDQSKDVLQIMLGALGTMAASVVAYFFGSSAGSARKNELLKQHK